MAREIQPKDLIHPIIQHYIEEHSPREYREVRQGWDELAEVAREGLLALTVPRPLAALMKEKDLLRFLPDIALFKSRLEQLQSDIYALTAEFKEIASQHAGYQGAPKNNEEFAEMFRISELYMAFKPRAGTALEEVFCHLVDMLNQAFDRYKRYHIEHDLPYRENYLNEVIEASLRGILEEQADPNGVSDVAYREHERAAAQAVLQPAEQEQTYEEAKAKLPPDTPIHF